MQQTTKQMTFSGVFLAALSWLNIPKYNTMIFDKTNIVVHRRKLFP